MLTFYVKDACSLHIPNLDIIFLSDQLTTDWCQPRNANRRLSLGIIDLIGKDRREESLTIQTKTTDTLQRFSNLFHVWMYNHYYTFSTSHLQQVEEKRGKAIPRGLSPSVILSSGAELSHCEQRVQSLFTNQLSSAPALRVSPRHSCVRARSPTPLVGRQAFLLCIFLSSCRRPTEKSHVFFYFYFLKLR